jgi:hypothetical protein
MWHLQQRKRQRPSSGRRAIAVSVAAELCYSKLYVDCVLSTRQEMSRVRQAVDAHVEDFVVNDELLLPILKSNHTVHSSIHANRNAPTNTAQQSPHRP